MIAEKVQTKKTSGFSLAESVKVQCSLAIGAVNDPLEHEADTMANKIMSMQEVPFVAAGSTGGIQRKCAGCEEEEKVQHKPLALFIQRKESSAGTFASDAVSNKLNASKGGGINMDSHTQTFMQNRFGADFTNVKIHTGGESIQMNRELNAKAFTFGNDIYFNEGQYNPVSNEGKHLLTHELTHTLQQGGERRLVQRTPEEVDIPDKERSRTCKAKRKYEILEKAASPSANFDVDSTNVTLNIKWCRGKTSGDITIGANVPEQAVKIAKDIIDIVRRGGGSSDIEEKLRGADLTPFVDILIKKGGAFSLTAHGEITVDSTGITGGKGSLDFDLGPVTISPHIEADKDTGLKGGVDIKIPFGGGKAPEVKCDTEKVRIGKKLTCECPTPATKVPGELLLPFLPETKFLYFDYNSEEINKERSTNSISEISVLLGKGYRVTNITGFTSPEGTLKPSHGFEGNEGLAERRAQAALAMIQQTCSPLRMRDSVNCAPNVAKELKPVGGGELHSVNNEHGKELKGKALYTHAISSFEGNEEEQQHLGVLTEDERTDLAKAKTARGKTKFIYPLLRRVKIMLAKSGTYKVPTEIIVPPGKEPCPVEILKQAEDKLPKMPF